MKKAIYIGKRIENMLNEKTLVSTDYNVHSIVELSVEKANGKSTKPMLWEYWDKDNKVPDCNPGQLCQFEMGYKQGRTKQGDVYMKPCVEAIYPVKG